MEIHKREYEKLNFEGFLQPLFDAMKNGEVISEINFIPRDSLTIKPLKKFQPKDYYVAMQENHKGNEKFDLVSGVCQGMCASFYMNWVQSFNL